MPADTRVLADLAAFARVEVASRDVEPWADLLAALWLPTEQAHWLVKGYNAFDSLSSGWQMFRRWSTVERWAAAEDRAEVAVYPCTQERRGLRGGRVVKHLDSFVENLAGQSIDGWIRSALVTGNPEQDFLALTRHVRSVWGAGRQTAFEWVEFVAKVLGIPVEAPDADLWESTGPRRALQRLYGEDHPDLGWLNERADETRSLLAAEGVPLSWEDFETVLCDFNVMRDGRYYPGRHLAALLEEINEVPEADQGPLMQAWSEVVPEPWCGIEPGIKKPLLAVYRDTGRIIDQP